MLKKVTHYDKYYAHNYFNYAIIQVQNLTRAWFLEITFFREVGMLVCVCLCVSDPEAINCIHVIFNLYNQLNKFVAFRNATKLSMHGRGL